jgi:tRNA(Met) C34 N-acetyltransferase TmcA
MTARPVPFPHTLRWSSQDVHSRFRTESHADVTGRFNERFILSLTGCQSCVVMDDELNVLPISSHIRNIKPFVKPEVSQVPTGAASFSVRLLGIEAEVALVPKLP